MERGSIANKPQLNTKKCLGRGKPETPSRKPPPPPPDHSLEISTTQDSCCTIDHYELSKPISLSILEPSKLQLATDFTKSFLFLPYHQRTSIEASMERPPI